MNGYKVVGDHVCPYTEGCLLEQGGDVAHRSCDCVTVESLMGDMNFLRSRLKRAKKKIKALKAEIYDLEREDRR
jgi:hypothetical protein